MYTQVGVITNTHGVKGSVKVYPYTFDVTRFEEYGQLFVGDDKELVNIKSVSYFKNLVILSFEEYSDINEVLKFKESKIYIKSTEEAVLDEGYYYISDIIGCKVYDQSNNYLGIITEVIQGASNDIYIVKSEKLQGQLPAVKEFIKNVDIDKKEMIVAPIEGMFNEIWYLNIIPWICEFN